MEEPLEIRLLGPFEVLAGGAIADVGGSKRQALLAMLALAQGRVVEVDTLVEGLWEEDELPAAPRNALHHHIARLRATIGESAIVGFPDGYALQGALVDAGRFEELLADARADLRNGDVPAAADAVESALALWRGAALQGLAGTAWFTAEARRLEALRVDALEERFEVALALGEQRELVPALRSALAGNPFRERLWGQLMLALYRSGRQADALEAFQEARRVLGDELGLEPGPDLRKLQDAILAQDPAIAPVAVDRRRRGNLPTATTSFVGREDALAQIAALLAEHRLVTLIGPPGVGKSRLAVETARSLEGEHPDGIWLVDLARAADEDEAVRLVARVLDVRGSDPLASVALRMRDARTLLVLDACEGVVDAAARIATAILATCQHVRVLGTSREALHVDGEARVPVVPLGLAGVDLFVERARAARPGFELAAGDIALAEDIVRRLDGLPLAIELAAARLNVLGLAELDSIFQRRVSLLRDVPESDPARAALATLLEWSYDLLHGDEKRVLQHVAVHRGGASLTSLVAISAAQGLSEATVAYLLAALVDKSILAASFASGAARYDMLDSVREYVLERLGEEGGLEAARAAHAEYYADLADEAGVELRGPEWLQWQRRLEPETDNFWAALVYARDAAVPAVAARLMRLGWYFALAERISEGRRFLELAVALSGAEPPLEVRIEQLAVLCYLATEELDLDAALEAGERALALAPEGAAPRQLALARLALALALSYTGDAEGSEAMARDAAAELDGSDDDWAAAAAALLRALAALGAEDVSTVAAMAEMARRRSEAIGYDAFLVSAMMLEAWVAERRGNVPGAVDSLRRAFELSTSVGFGDHAAFALAALGAIALAQGDRQGAEELQRQSLATAESAGAEWPAAYARVQLARAAAGAGDNATAERLYRQVLEWSQRKRPHQGRETLFLALAGSPEAAAELGLAELGETALT